nr:hypothetical protein [Micromonospora sp. DSM 115978]
MTADHRDQTLRPPTARTGGDTRRADDPSAAGEPRPAGPAGADPGAPDGPPDARPLVRVTVNLTPRAVDSLDQACLRTHDSKTDTINRALVVYNIVLELLERGGGSLTLQTRNGVEHVHLL